MHLLTRVWSSPPSPSSLPSGSPRLSSAAQRSSAAPAASTGLDSQSSQTSPSAAWQLRIDNIILSQSCLSLNPFMLVTMSLELSHNLESICNLLCPERQLPVVGTDPGIRWHSQAGAGAGLSRVSGAIGAGAASPGARRGRAGALWTLTARRDWDQTGAWVRGEYSASYDS